MVLTVIDKEVDKFADKDSRRIFIGGESQGCVMSLAAFLRYNKTTPLGGLMGHIGVNLL